ncbi:ATP-binding cassette sub-family A member 2 [Eumeta japonica]|uniref:ATP-binding cassette sub-family A member 2 n=1 Tax=Eumeta variegata TaxID=151549 RepID=A0A4C1VUY2_EUMVA|nr:ATP-binding cassette sub-family A member 2 [Eumeta japonica]
MATLHSTAAIPRQATDNARWTLHKVFLLSPQFALGDALLEIAKNTVQAQVLSRFGMDTYKNPFETDLILYHCVALVLVGLFMLLLNLAIEYNCFDHWICSWRNRAVLNVEMEDLEVAAERKRVEASARDRDRPVTLHTIGNINAGFVDTESKKGSIKQIVSPMCDVAQCVGLGRTYRGVTSRIALKSLYLGIPPGQCTALLGQNGAGKSTTFALLSGELRATCGRVVLNGSAVTSRQICSGLISYCPQSDALDPLLTVTQTLQFYCRLRGIADVNEVVKRTLQTFDLRKYSRQRCGTLSGGNRRKLCTAVAFMGRAPLVLLDEPTSGMDPGSRWCVARGVRAACAARRGVLLSTHALEDARVLASRVALLRDGALCALAPLDQCLQRFGSGHVVSARAERGGAARLWLEVRARAPQAQLQAMHHNTLQFLVPTKANVEGKEVVTQLSDVFRLLAALQGTAELDDYTLNASSLDQMFLNFSDRSDRTITADEPPMSARRNSDQLESVTAL